MDVRQRGDRGAARGAGAEDRRHRRHHALIGQRRLSSPAMPSRSRATRSSPALADQGGTPSTLFAQSPRRGCGPVARTASAMPRARASTASMSKLSRARASGESSSRQSCGSGAANVEASDAAISPRGCQSAAPRHRRLERAPHEQRRIDHPRIGPLRLERGAHRVREIGHLLDRRGQRVRAGHADRRRRAGGVAAERRILDRREKSVGDRPAARAPTRRTSRRRARTAPPAGRWTPSRRARIGRSSRASASPRTDPASAPRRSRIDRSVL